MPYLLWGDITPFLRDTLRLEQDHIDQLKATLEIIRRHDEETYWHCRRVGDLAYHAGLVLGTEPRALFYAGVLHDFGKVLVPGEILRKTGTAFTDEDYERVKPHAFYGYLMLKGPYPFSAEILVRHHLFQRLPYPEDLPSLDVRFSEKEKSLIERCAHILALVDFYDAFTTREDREKDASLCVCDALSAEYGDEREALDILFREDIFHHSEEHC